MVPPPGNYRPLFGSVSHYYGDGIRVWLLVAAVLLAVAIPLSGGATVQGAPVFVSSIIVLVIFAGLTNPHGRAVLIIDAIISGVGAAVLGLNAIALYQSGNMVLSLVETLAGCALLIALYFSVKTVRALAMHAIGKRDDPSEFSRSE